MTIRKEILSQIIEESKIQKIAQEVGNQPGEIDKETADKLAEEIFDQLYKEELQKLLQS